MFQIVGSLGSLVNTSKDNISLIFGFSVTLLRIIVFDCGDDHSVYFGAPSFKIVLDCIYLYDARNTRKVQVVFQILLSVVNTSMGYIF